MEGAVKGLILATTLLAVAVVAGCSADGVDKATPTTPAEQALAPTITPQALPAPTERSTKAPVTDSIHPPPPTTTPTPSPVATPNPPSQTATPTPVVPTPAVQPIPPSTGSQVGSVLPVWDLTPSLDEQIFFSDIIVVATLASVSASTESVPGDSGGSIKYRPLHVLQFRANQYLKGTGPNDFTVEVSVQPGIADARDYSGYSTEAAALQTAKAHLNRRNSAYDDRQGILFLDGPLESVKSSTATSSGGSGRSDGESNQQADSSTMPSTRIIGNILLIPSAGRGCQPKRVPPAKREALLKPISSPMVPRIHLRRSPLLH